MPQRHPELKMLAHDATELEVTPSQYWMGHPNLTTIGQLANFVFGADDDLDKDVEELSIQDFS